MMRDMIYIVSDIIGNNSGIMMGLLQGLMDCLTQCQLYENMGEIFL